MSMCVYRSLFFFLVIFIIIVIKYLFMKLVICCFFVFCDSFVYVVFIVLSIVFGTYLCLIEIC